MTSHAKSEAESLQHILAVVRVIDEEVTLDICHFS